MRHLDKPARNTGVGTTSRVGIVNPILANDEGQALEEASIDQVVYVRVPARSKATDTIAIGIGELNARDDELEAGRHDPSIEVSLRARLQPVRSVMHNLQ
jgi:hypothetical protein